MSVWIKVKISGDEGAFETEVQAPLMEIGATTANFESNRNSISKFTNQFIDDALIRIDTFDMGPMSSSATSLLEHVGTATGRAENATTRPAPATETKEAGDERIRVRIIMPWSTVTELKISPHIKILHLKEVYESKPGCSSLAHMHLLFEGKSRGDGETLNSIGFKDGDALYAT